jgi:hypothetical protein
MFTDPRAGIVAFLPLCDAYIEGMAKANAKSKATYRSNFANPAVRTLLDGKSVLDAARMDAEVKTLLNVTLGSYSDDYRGNVRRIITGTLDECVRRGVIPRHTPAGIELSARIVTAEQYEAQNKGLVCVPDDTVRMLADGLTVTGTDTNGRSRVRVMPGVGIAAWLQRTMGYGRGPAGRPAVPRPGRHPVHAVQHGRQPVRPDAGLPRDQRRYHPLPAPPVRDRGPRRRPPRTRQHLRRPGP